MLCFDGIFDSLGMTPWSSDVPELHREIIVGIESAEAECKSSRGFDLMRGWYSTWIIGPNTEGCGMHQQAILDMEPEAHLQWHTQPVMLVSVKLNVTGSIRPGVIPAELLEPGAWWAYYDDLIQHNETLVPLHEYVKLQRDVCKTRIKHEGIFYPLKR